ncbi:DUF255 domain-containing protein [Hanstruepera marina]|uniref:DUF255 domain-containing protein n=1 Tax=Hanstruepera marina TaxID=2873265 RepID=UPI001CA7905B|nr:DUF255 domain-containing protein [Hanstruepera marina]
MKITFCLIFLLTLCKGFNQEKLNYFQGDFDEALKQAKITNKDIFFITKGNPCPVYDVFQLNLNNDNETINFLNDNFIVFEFDLNKSSDVTVKRLKDYYDSWRGSPQLYFIDQDENLITEITYTLEYSHAENLGIWKDYLNIEENWKTIKKEKRNNLTLKNLKQFLLYRNIKYSPYGLMQIKNVIDKYFKSLPKENYSDSENWDIIQKYVTIWSNNDLFSFVADNKSKFQKKNDPVEVSKYLSLNYNKYLSSKSKADIEKLSTKYPYTTIEEAKIAIQEIQNSAKPQLWLEN